MPTYQYACTACGHQLEAVQSFSDAPLTECPECAGRLRKVFNSVGIVFKGSGFYRTDSRSNGSDTSSNGSKPAKADSSSGSGGSSSSASSSSSSSSSASSSNGSGSSSKAPAASSTSTSS
ncbi:FmdB family transcriptional regulator [Micromonospora costi]|uniref:FmdB family transcriptional regulator n=1 Tax=Micromonospora costi TaxID=1530042 RepID=A0A3B0ADR3_9ACTN|nr:FmdB family transcriptional regulator [Micromonospora costi]